MNTINEEWFFIDRILVGKRSISDQGHLYKIFRYKEAAYWGALMMSLDPHGKSFSILTEKFAVSSKNRCSSFKIKIKD